MANDYAINYDDQRFKDVEADKKTAIAENDKVYGNMINSSDEFYNAQIDASKEWADKQSQLQQEQTDFAIEQIEQQKDQKPQEKKLQEQKPKATPEQIRIITKAYGDNLGRLLKKYGLKKVEDMPIDTASAEVKKITE